MNKFNDDILNLQEVIDFSGIGRSTLYVMMKEGRFPQSVKISTRRIGWLLTDINKWMQELKERNDL